MKDVQVKYNNAKTPEQLLKYMDENIKYVFIVNNGKEVKIKIKRRLVYEK